MSPTVTIITVCLNSEKLISNAISSVFSQTHKKIEYIIVDGGSTDNTLNIIRKHEPLFGGRLKMISEPDDGCYHALNKGLAMATGDIVGVLHSDDVFASANTIEHVVAAFSSLDLNKTNQLSCVYGDLIYVKANDPTRIVRHWKSKDFSSDQLKKGWMPPHPTLFMHRSVYEKHGFFDLNFSIAADYEMILRVFSDPCICIHYLPEIITIMRTGGISNKNISHLIKKSQEDYRIMKKHNYPYPLQTLVLKNFSKIKQFANYIVFK